jgi:nucleotide-binding universal stress UspA family protein
VYKRIVVPLDGSKLAEAIVPTVYQFAKGMDAVVELVAIVDQDIVAPEGERLTWGEEVAREAVNKAERYLRGVSSFIPLQPERMRTFTTIGRVPEGILSQAGGQPGTLIAMSTHGSSGVGRFLLGSTTEKVLRLTKNHLLLYRPGRGGTPQEHFDTVIVPLDGSIRASKVLPAVKDMARTLGLRIVLLRARRTIPAYGGTMGVDWYDPGLELEDEQASAGYLREKQRELEQAGFSVSTKLVEGGAPAAIIELSKQTANAFIAMTTRGRTGAARVALGSVADRVVRHAEAPVLLIKA